MNKSFGQHIVNLLKEHECVVLPTIGALVLKKVPVYISNGQFFPATKKSLTIVIF